MKTNKILYIVIILVIIILGIFAFIITKPRSFVSVLPSIVSNLPPPTTPTTIITPSTTPRILTGTPSDTVTPAVVPISTSSATITPSRTPGAPTSTPSTTAVTPVVVPTHPYYVVTIHVNPAVTKDLSLVDPVKAEKYLSDSILRLKQEVDYADKYKVKLSIWFSAIMANYVSSDPKKLAEVQRWAQEGHEIGLHHHSVYRPTEWDGYTNLPENEALAIRAGLKQSESYKGTLTDLINIIKKINPNVNSGVNSEAYGFSEALPDQIIYSTGAGYANYGTPGIKDSPQNVKTAINEYVTTGIINGIKRYFLTHYEINSMAMLKSVVDMVSTTNPKSIISVIAHNEQNNIEPFKGFIDFVHSKDPEAKDSLTVTQAIKLLPEKSLSADFFK